MTEIIYREQLPEPSLQPFIECFWSLEAKAAFSNAILPDGCVDIVYSQGLGLQVAGPMTRPHSVRMPASSRTIGIRFRPGMAKSAVGVSPLELRDAFAEGRWLWPNRADEIEDRLSETKKDGEAFRILRELLPRTSPPQDGISRCLFTLATGKGLLEINELARQTNLSVRQFRRRCLAESGYSPKHLSRLLRFREARDLSLQRAKPKWAEIAIQAGYFDQAHLIRDFTEFAGAAPSMSVLSNI